MTIGMSGVKAARKAKTTDEFIELVLNKPMARKSNQKLTRERVCYYTGKSVCYDKGMLNPLKLNISKETLSKIR